MKNSFYEVSKSFALNIKLDTTLDLLDLNDTDESIKIDLSIEHGVQLIVNFTVLNFNKLNKSIVLNINFNHSNAHCEINLNCLGLNQSISKLSVNGICETSTIGYLDIKINGIIDSDQAKIIGCPNFKFNTNKIDAHHSLVIGGVNPVELDFLASRMIAQADAKYLLITAKLFKCLQNLDQTRLAHHQKQILNRWETQHVKY